MTNSLYRAPLFVLWLRTLENLVVDGGVRGVVIHDKRFCYPHYTPPPDDLAVALGLDQLSLPYCPRLVCFEL